VRGLKRDSITSVANFLRKVSETKVYVVELQLKLFMEHL
jgi:hypothetical protein